jgi:hypothetical protein
MTSNLNTDRRAFLAAAPALAALTAGPALAASSAVDPDFAQCVAAYQRADRAYHVHYETRFSPVEQAFREAEKAVPHYVTKASMDVGEGQFIHFTTADRMHRRLAEDFGGRFDDDDGFVGGCASELLKALNERDARIKALRRETGYDTVRTEQWELLDDMTDALRAVEAYPVTNIKDLLRKVELLKGEVERDDIAGLDIDADVLLADLRRIEGRA